MIPGAYTALAGAIGIALAFGGGYKLGIDAETATQAREDKASEKAAQTAADAAAKAISKLEVQRVEITSKAQQIIREVPVYRSDCAHPGSMLDEINRARLGIDPSELPSSGSHD